MKKGKKDAKSEKKAQDSYKTRKNKKQREQYKKDKQKDKEDPYQVRLPPEPKIITVSDIRSKLGSLTNNTFKKVHKDVFVLLASVTGVDCLQIGLNEGGYDVLDETVLGILKNLVVFQERKIQFQKNIQIRTDQNETNEDINDDRENQPAVIPPAHHEQTQEENENLITKNIYSFAYKKAMDKYNNAEIEDDDNLNQLLKNESDNIWAGTSGMTAAIIGTGGNCVQYNFEDRIKKFVDFFGEYGAGLGGERVERLREVVVFVEPNFVYG